MVKDKRPFQVKPLHCLEWKHKMWESIGWNYKCPVCDKSYEENEIIGYTKPESVYFDSYTFSIFIRCKNCGKRYSALDGN